MSSTTYSSDTLEAIFTVADSFFTILQQNYRFHPSWFAVLGFFLLKHFSKTKKSDIFWTFRSPPGVGFFRVWPFFVHLVVFQAADLHSRTAPGRNF